MSNIITNALKAFFSPISPSERPITVETAETLLSRSQFSSLLNLRDFDDEKNLIIFEDIGQTSIGFMLEYSPLLVAGVDAEPQFQAIIDSAPEGSALQFACFASKNIEPVLTMWEKARLENCTNDILRQVTERRKQFMMMTQDIHSATPASETHPRIIRYFLTLKVPYKGSKSSAKELTSFLASITDLRDQYVGAFQGAGIYAEPMIQRSVKLLFRELLNPEISPSELMRTDVDVDSLVLDLVDNATRVTLEDDGLLKFEHADKTDPRYNTKKAICITADAYPKKIYLPNTAKLIGDPLAREEKINCPFYAYTNIFILDQEPTIDRLITKLGVYNKQTASESEWYRSMMGHMYERKNNVEGLINELKSGKNAIRFYSGITLFSNEDDAKKNGDYALSLWRRAGFRASIERVIALPAFLASLPGQYHGAMDRPNQGLWRGVTGHSMNAAALVHAQGDWSGTDPAKGGPLLMSRRGHLAVMDLLQTSINYNFTIVAASGSGKSFFCNEIASDFLSKGGMVRIIDVGRSYFRFAALVGGQNQIFNPQQPISMNPFSSVTSEEKLSEMMPLLKSLIRQMAYPHQPEKETPPWQFQSIEAAVTQVWQMHRENTELSHVYEWLLQYEDERAKDLAFQIAPFAIGRYRAWFTGPNQLNFKSDMVVVELEELKQDPELQNIVLALTIAHITQEMYLGDRKKPKCLAVDEAWDLLGGEGKASGFIETAFRRARKYNAIAGIITQAYSDAEKSPSARAAFDNAAWTFQLHQRPESIQYAVDKKMIVSNEYLIDLMKSVKSGPGFSEIYIKGEGGQGVYRFVTDRHSYYTFTTNPKDINKLNDLTSSGLTVAQAIDKLATEDYKQMWGI